MNRKIKISVIMILLLFSFNIIPVYAYNIGDKGKMEIPSWPGGSYGGGYDYGGGNSGGGGTGGSGGSSGGGGSNTGNETTKPGGSTSTPSSVGTKNNPFKRYVNLSSNYNNSSVLKEVNAAINSTPENGEKKYTWKTPGSSSVTSSSTQWVPDYISNPPTPFWMTTYYSSIWIQTKSTVTENSTYKDKFYRWTVSGVESYTKDSTDNTFSLTFTKTGLYKVSVVPHEERTKNIKGTIKGYAYDTWPKASGKKAVLITSTTKNIPSTNQTSVSANNARRMEWEFYVTASDIGKVIPIPIDPTPPPGVTPPSGGVGNPDIEDEDADVTIID